MLFNCAFAFWFGSFFRRFSLHLPDLLFSLSRIDLTHGAPPPGAGPNSEGSCRISPPEGGWERVQSVARLNRRRVSSGIVTNPWPPIVTGSPVESTPDTKVGDAPDGRASFLLLEPLLRRAVGNHSKGKTMEDKERTRFRGETTMVVVIRVFLFLDFALASFVLTQFLHQ